MAVVAKGAKRPYSQLRSVLLPFQRLVVGCTQPRRATVPRCRPWRRGMGRRQAMLTGAALFSGFYLNELLMKLLARADPHPALFDIYAETCLHSEARTILVQAALRAFEVTLLQRDRRAARPGLVTLTPEAVTQRVKLAAAGRGGCRVHLEQRGSVAGSRARSDCRPRSSRIPWPHCSRPAWCIARAQGGLRGLLHYHLGSPVLRTRQLMMELQQK